MMNHDKEILNANELAEFLGISKTVAYRLLHQDDFPVLRLGKRLLVPRDSLKEWIASHSNHSN